MAKVFQLTVRIGEDGIADSKELALALIDAASRFDHGASDELSGECYFVCRYMGRTVGRGVIVEEGS